MGKQIQGLLLKGIGGFYYVEAADTVYECKARGVFRKQKITPLVGDTVRITVYDDGQENTIDAIAPRKNFFTRPPVANIDTLMIVVSMLSPKPSLLIIDELIAIAESKAVEPILVFTKTDLEDAKSYIDIYQKAGITAIPVSNTTGEGVDNVRTYLNGKITAFTGNSGVGKTSLLNALDHSFTLETGEISEKLGRGRHTTRQATLFKTCGGYIVDTPGFSSLDFYKSSKINKHDLASCFREFKPYLGTCQFTTCTHTCDKGCKIIEAVKNGEISSSRHESYVSMYQEIKDIKEWET